MKNRRSTTNTILKQLKAQLRAASVNQIIDLAADGCGVAIFPEAHEAVQINAYFGRDLPDAAAEEYWRRQGPRATLMLDVIDVGLYDLPQDWLDDLQHAVKETSEIALSWDAIKQLVEFGLVAKAEEIRRRVLASNLTEAIENALTEIREREGE